MKVRNILLAWVFPYWPIRTRARLVGALLALVLHLVIALDRISSGVSGWLLWVPLVSAGWIFGLLQAYVWPWVLRNGLPDLPAADRDRIGEL